MIKLNLVFWQLLLLAAFTPAIARENKKAADVATHAEIAALLQGHYDNREQTEKSQSTASAENPATPRLAVIIDSTQSPDWQLWRMHLDAGPDESPIDAVWAMQISHELDGSTALIPWNLRSSAPATATDATAFDVEHWFSLEACALRGEFGKTHVSGAADGMPCVVVATGIGSRRTLLPVVIDRHADSLELHLIYHGLDVRFDERRLP
jgi:hypothetical protein